MDNTGVILESELIFGSGGDLNVTVYVEVS